MHKDELYDRDPVDSIYDFMDDSLLSGDFAACKTALSSAAPEKMSHAEILSFLMVTQKAKKQLDRERTDYFDRAMIAVSTTPCVDYAEKLLRNNE